MASADAASCSQSVDLPMVEAATEEPDEGEVERESPLPPVVPFALLEEEDASDEDEPSNALSLCLAPGDDALRDLERLVRLKRDMPPAIPRPIAWEVAATHAISSRMAHRVMRDALGLQLARRGFDGLRQSALWLVTELAADFLRALGTQLQREGPASASTPPTSIVRCMQRHANMHGLGEWRHAQQTFARFSEPVGPSTSTTRILERQTIAAPPAISPLYSAMRNAWTYKQSTAGRQAHSAAGAADVPSASSAQLAAGVTGRELSESLRLSKKQRQQAESWLQASTGNMHTAPLLLPGKSTEAAPGSGADAGAAGGGGGGRGRSRKAK